MMDVTHATVMARSQIVSSMPLVRMQGDAGYLRVQTKIKHGDANIRKFTGQ
jgi:hypothetical protein